MRIFFQDLINKLSKKKSGLPFLFLIFGTFSEISNLHPSPPTIQDLIERAKPLEPILFILAEDGSNDPSSQLETIADSVLGPDAYFEVIAFFLSEVSGINSKK